MADHFAAASPRHRPPALAQLFLPDDFLRLIHCFHRVIVTVHLTVESHDPRRISGLKQVQFPAQFHHAVHAPSWSDLAVAAVPVITSLRQSSSNRRSKNSARAAVHTLATGWLQ